MNRASFRLLPLALVLSLPACAASGDYPSLARRPAERITGSAEVAPPETPPSPTPAPASPELAARLAQLVEQARDGHRRFAEKRGATERLVAAAGGAAPASESWSVAHVALGDLEAARSATVIALGALDELYAAESVRAAETGEPGNADAAADAHAQVAALVSEENAVLARLRDRLRG